MNESFTKGEGKRLSLAGGKDETKGLPLFFSTVG
ncbi:hypothetical protein Pla8534_63650 [Lignipirellula cremea]|uniref:Uncharacterized protein n=1 Tax=Lignipirellula cremea TaxID=2528010 RepID=A0A518E326_9BACT|nr:hypothetical protein Pla8534_63650 [Lignipirellula cremea]